MPLSKAREMMNEALNLARAAAAQGEVPVGAIVVKDGVIIGRGAAAAHLGNDRLTGCDLWVTLEPCAMCAGAIAHSRIARLYYGAEDPKGGAVAHGPRLFEQPTVHHRPEIYSGISADESAELLQAFFKDRR